MGLKRTVARTCGAAVSSEAAQATKCVARPTQVIPSNANARATEQAA